MPSGNSTRGLRTTESPPFDSGLYLLDVPDQGKGVFTSREYRPGEKILVFGGDLTHSNEIDDFTHYLQIGPMLYLGPSGSFDDFVNHNCDPNCAVYFDSDELVLKSIKHIKKDEQLSFDYSTIIFNEPTSFMCGCKSPVCRHEIGNFFTLSTEYRERYLSRGMVPLLTRYQIQELGFSQ